MIDSVLERIPTGRINHISTSGECAMFTVRESGVTHSIIIDSDDAPKVLGLSWRFCRGRLKSKIGMLQHLVMGVKRKFLHVNGDRFDYRKRNLVLPDLPSMRKRYAMDMRRKVARYLVKGCVCGQYHGLQFHHRDPRTKSFTVTSYAGRKWSEIEAEIAKCDVLCMRCHRRVHSLCGRDPEKILAEAEARYENVLWSLVEDRLNKD